MAVVRSERRNRATAAAGDDQPRKSSTDFKKSSVPVSIAVLLNWRRHPDSNRGIRVLQTLALPLGYAASARRGILPATNQRRQRCGAAGSNLASASHASPEAAATHRFWKQPRPSR